MKLSEEIKKTLNEDVKTKFKKGDKVKLTGGDYEGLWGKVISAPYKVGKIMFYDVEVLGGETTGLGQSHHIGREGETNFYGEKSWYKKIIACDELGLKKK